MLNACTIIACNYLPFARVLARSFFTHHPGGSFAVLVIDADPPIAEPGRDDPRVRWMGLGDLGLDADEIRRLIGIYDVTELATAVKPLLLGRLLDAGTGAALYLDPDIRIYAPLDEAARLAEAHGITLTPHSMQPYPRDERAVDSAMILAVGVFNLGFIAVGQQARPFLDWWWQATRREALHDVTHMMFTDQRWIDFAPCFFSPAILKDPGYNVAYWNLHGRTVTADGDAWFVNGSPLRFFHFSGYDVRKPFLLSKHQGTRPRVLLSEQPEVERLCQAYGRELATAGMGEIAPRPYAWNTTAAGLPMATRMRRLYRDALVAAEAGHGAEPPSPFDPLAPGAFVDWLNAPAPDGPRRVSRYLHDIYRDRMDLQIRFPDAGGADAAGFADWVWKYGVEDEVIPLELRPPRDPSAAAAPLPAVAEHVHVAGYFRAELGIGEAARLLTGALTTAGLAYSTTTNEATLSRQAHPFDARVAPGTGWDINVVCVNADSTPQFARDAGPGFFAGRHTAGYWFWEVERFPSSMHGAFEFVDEVWAATDFVAGAIRAAASKPVFTIPLPLAAPRRPASLSRAQIGLPDGYVFLLTFDLMSVMERKNPLGLIDAFSRAFTPGEGPTLVIKTINGSLRLLDLERLRAAARARPDIVILDRYYTAEEKDAAIALCDCYVSLHRSEGLGLTMAEAMAAGRPVIATGYSGNLHFMRPETTHLIDYTLTAVGPGHDPYPEDASWASPDLDQAAARMREVYEQPERAAARAARAQRDLFEDHGAARPAAAVAARIGEIRRLRQSYVIMPGPAVSVRPPSSTAASQPGSSIEPLERVLPQLTELASLKLSEPEGGLAGLRRAAQRLLFRVLRPYAFQQAQLQQQLIAALGHAAAAIREEQRTRETLDARLREVTRELLAAKRELRRLQGEVERTPGNE